MRAKFSWLFLVFLFSTCELCLLGCEEPHRDGEGYYGNATRNNDSSWRISPIRQLDDQTVNSEQIKEFVADFIFVENSKPYQMVKLNGVRVDDGSECEPNCKFPVFEVNRSRFSMWLLDKGALEKSPDSLVGQAFSAAKGSRTVEKVVLENGTLWLFSAGKKSRDFLGLVNLGFGEVIVDGEIEVDGSSKDDPELLWLLNTLDEAVISQ